MVNIMKLIIKSKQNYGTHTEAYDEEFECTTENNENSLRISFDNGFIQIEKEKIVYERNENKIVIEPGKTNECDYETEHGIFVLDIKGLEIKCSIEEVKKLNNEEKKVAEARYEIQMVGVEPYENYIEIVLI